MQPGMQPGVDSNLAPAMHYDPVKGGMVPDQLPAAGAYFPGAVPSPQGGFFPPTTAVAPPMPMYPQPAAFAPQPQIFVPPVAAYYPPAAPYFPPMPPYNPPYIPPFIAPLAPVVDESWKREGSATTAVSADDISAKIAAAQRGEGMGRGTGVPEPLLMAPDGTRVAGLPAGTTWSSSSEGVLTAKYPDGSSRVITSGEPGTGSMVTTLADGTVITTKLSTAEDGSQIISSSSSTGESSQVVIASGGDISATRTSADGSQATLPVDDVTKAVALATAGDHRTPQDPQVAPTDGPPPMGGFDDMPQYVAPNYQVAFATGPTAPGYMPAGMYPPVISHSYAVPEPFQLPVQPQNIGIFAPVAPTAGVIPTNTGVVGAPLGFLGGPSAGPAINAPGMPSMASGPNYYPGGIPSVSNTYSGGNSYTNMPDGTAFSTSVDGTATTFFPDGSSRTMPVKNEGHSTSQTTLAGGQEVSNSMFTDAAGNFTAGNKISNGASTDLVINADGSRTSNATSASGTMTSVANNSDGSRTAIASAPSGVSTTTVAAPDGSSSTTGVAGDGTTTVQNVAVDGSTSTSVTSPAGVQVSNDGSGTTVNTVQGNVVVSVNADGSVNVIAGEAGSINVNPDSTFFAPNGVSLDANRSASGGHQIVGLADGTSVMIYNDGAIAVNTSEGFTVNSGTNGSAVVTAPDGVCVTTSPDGQLIVAAGDGSTFVVANDGYMNVNTTDGCALSITPAGTITATDFDGCSLTNTTDGFITLAQSDGTCYIQSCDGDFTIASPNGMSYTNSVDGSNVVALPSGTMFSVDPNGAACTAAPGVSYFDIPNGPTAWNTAAGTSMMMDSGAAVSISGESTYVVTADGMGVAQTFAYGNPSTIFSFADGSAMTAGPDSAVFTGSDGTVFGIAVDDWENFDTSMLSEFDLPVGACLEFDFNFTDGGGFTIPDGDSGVIELGGGLQLAWTTNDGQTFTADDSGFSYTNEDGVTLSFDDSGTANFNNGDGQSAIFAFDGTSAVIVEDGASITNTAGGVAVISCGDDSCFTIGVDGTTTISAPDGTTIVAGSDGTTIVNDYAGNTVVTLMDGSTLITCDDGIVINSSSDGSTAIATDDGATVVVTSDGTSSASTDDGLAVINTSDGTTVTMIDGDVYVTSDQGTVAYADGAGVSLPDGESLTLNDGGAQLVTSEAAAFAIDAEGAVQISTPEGESFQISEDGGFVWSDADGSNVSVDPDSMIIDANYAFGVDIGVSPDGDLNVVTADGCEVNMYSDGSTSVMMSDASSVVVPDDGGISVSAADGTDVEVSNDGSVSIDTPSDATLSIDADGSVAVTPPAQPDYEAYQINVVDAVISDAAEFDAVAADAYEVVGGMPVLDSNVEGILAELAAQAGSAVAVPTEGGAVVIHTAAELQIATNAEDAPQVLVAEISDAAEFDAVPSSDAATLFAELEALVAANSPIFGSANPEDEFPSSPEANGEFPPGDAGTDFEQAVDSSVFPDSLPEPEPATESAEPTAEAD